MENRDNISLRQIAAQIGESKGIRKEDFDNFYSEIKNRYKEILQLLNLPEDTYKCGNKYNIPLSIKPVILFFLSEAKENKVLQHLRKENREKQKMIKEGKLSLYKMKRFSKDEKYSFGLTGEESIRNELINFILETDQLDYKEKMHALIELNNNNAFQYVQLCEIGIVKINEKLDKIVQKFKKDRPVDLYFPQGVYLISEYFKRMEKELDNILEELDYALDTVIGDNTDNMIPKEYYTNPEWEYLDEDENIGEEDVETNLLEENDMKQIMGIVHNAINVAYDIRIENNEVRIKNKITKEETKRLREEIDSLILERENNI